MQTSCTAPSAHPYPTLATPLVSGGAGVHYKLDKPVVAPDPDGSGIFGRSVSGTMFLDPDLFTPDTVKVSEINS